MNMNKQAVRHECVKGEMTTDRVGLKAVHLFTTLHLRPTTFYKITPRQRSRRGLTLQRDKEVASVPQTSISVRFL